MRLRCNVSDSGREWGANSDEAIRAKNRMPYDAIIKKRMDGRTMTMGKHKAANAATCERIISSLENGNATQREAAEWAIWMVWWRLMDSQTQQQIDEMRVEEIAALRKRVDQLEREKRGIGHDDQYA